MNESLFITQVIDRKVQMQDGSERIRSYVFLSEYGCPYTELYDVLQEFLDSNKAKQQAAIEAEAKKENEKSVDPI